MPSEGVRYIKIAKIDKDGIDQTLSLQSMTQITIPYSSGNVVYDILNTTEQSTYFLYYVENPNIEWDDRAEIEYTFTGSLPGESYSDSTRINILPIVNNISDPLDFFDSNVGAYKLDTYPQKEIYVEFTGSVYIQGTGTRKSVVGIALGNPSNPPSTINEIAFVIVEGSNSTETFYISASIPESDFTGRVGDYIFPYLDFNNPTPSPDRLIFSESFLYISSSVSTGPTIESIPEPYFTENWNRSLDCHPILNNAIENRKSIKYQDIDYTTELLTPTNFELLISGSALKAQVQDSNYTLARHTNPRYDGSRSTSQFINKWTEGDINTYGKTPTVESTKVYAAYCDWIGGWPPERMGASAAHVIYLIKDDGTIILPNTSENSLAIHQGTFVSGEFVEVNSQTPNSGNPTAIRKVIRGGTRIEPILYTQVGHSPAQWSSAFSFTTNFITDQVSVADYQATAYYDPTINPSYPTIIPNGNVFSGLNFNNPVYLGGAAIWATNGYQVEQGVIDENVNLNIKLNMPVYIKAGAIGAQNHIVTLKLIHTKNGTEYTIAEQSFTNNQNGYYSTVQIGTVNFDVNISPQDVFVGDKFFIRGRHKTSTYAFAGEVYYNNNSSFKVNQNPSPTVTEVTSTGENTIWSYPDISNTSVISSSNQVLSNLYDKNFFQIDDTNSGFNNISLPWSLKIGDEFRFEGKEESTFMVKEVFDIGDTGSNRISPLGSIEVHFNSNLPSESIDLDHFLVRRYLDDASAILIEGYKPLGTDGPFLIKPEYTSKGLNKDMGSYIEDLTERGLI